MTASQNPASQADRLALVRHWVYEGRWSTARALASHDPIALAYVRDAAARLAHTATDALGDASCHPTFEGYSHALGTDGPDDGGDGDAMGEGDGDGHSDGGDFNFGAYNGDGHGFGDGFGLGDGPGDGDDHETRNGDGIGTPSDFQTTPIPSAPHPARSSAAPTPCPIHRSS